MPHVKLKPGQSIEDAIKQFNHKVRRSGNLQELRKRSQNVKRSDRKRAKRANNHNKKHR